MNLGGTRLAQSVSHSQTAWYVLPWSSTASPGAASTTLQGSSEPSVPYVTSAHLSEAVESGCAAWIRRRLSCSGLAWEPGMVRIAPPSAEVAVR